MNLHRASNTPDWEKVDPASRNVFQKIAARTRGAVTPANMISIAGLGLVFYGLMEIFNHNIWTGLALLAIGRLLDVADGWIAEATQTKSLIGEGVDAIADKLGTLLTIAVLFALDIAPWWVISALLIPQAIAPLIVFYKEQKGSHIHPTRSGKLSMAMAWTGIVGLFVVELFGHSNWLVVLAYVAIGLSLAFGLRALWQYAHGRD